MIIKAIVFNTFKEAIRNRFLYLLFFLGIFFAFSSYIISLLSIGGEEKVLMDVGLAAINFFSVLIAIFTGINLVYKEIDKKTVFNILSKPVSRENFIIGKFLGLAYTMFITLFLMAIIFVLFLYIAIGSFDANLLYFFILLYIELLVIISISLLFSSFSTPILSSIFTISIYLLGNVTWTFNYFKHMLTSTLSKFIAYPIYYVFPNLDKFNIKNDLVSNGVVDLTNFFYSSLYGIFYTVTILIITIIIFKRREFK